MFFLPKLQNVVEKQVGTCILSGGDDALRASSGEAERLLPDPDYPFPPPTPNSLMSVGSSNRRLAPKGTNFGLLRQYFSKKCFSQKRNETPNFEIHQSLGWGVSEKVSAIKGIRFSQSLHVQLPIATYMPCKSCRHFTNCNL